MGWVTGGRQRIEQWAAAAGEDGCSKRAEGNEDAANFNGWKISEEIAKTRNWNQFINADSEFLF